MVVVVEEFIIILYFDAFHNCICKEYSTLNTIDITSRRECVDFMIYWDIRTLAVWRSLIRTSSKHSHLQSSVLIKFTFVMLNSHKFTPAMLSSHKIHILIKIHSFNAQLS